MFSSNSSNNTSSSSSSSSPSNLQAEALVTYKRRVFSSVSMHKQVNKKPKVNPQEVLLEAIPVSPEKYENEIKSLKAELAEQKALTDKYRLDLAVNEGKLATKTTELYVKGRDLALLQQETVKVSQEFAKVREQKSQLGQALQRERINFANHQKAHAAEIQKLNVTIATYQNQINGFMHATNALNNTATTEIYALSQIINSLNNQLSELKTQASIKQAEIEKLQPQNVSLQTQLEGYKKTAETLQAKYDSLKPILARPAPATIELNLSNSSNNNFTLFSSSNPLIVHKPKARLPVSATQTQGTSSTSSSPSAFTAVPAHRK